MVEYKLPHLFYIEHKLTIINFFLFLCDFLVKFVTCYIEIHYEKFQNVNFIALIRSCVLLAFRSYLQQIQ